MVMFVYDLAMLSVVVLALDDVIAFDLATAVETFRWVVVADGTPGYRITVAGPRRVVRSGPISIMVEHDLAALDQADLVIVPGRGDPTIEVDPDVITALREAHEGGARIASICVGAFDLAATGLLDGRRATTHWRAAGLLAARHPLVTVDPAVLFVDGGAVLTSAGAAAGLDLCLHIIEGDYGASVAVDAARAAVMPLARDGGQAQFIDYGTASMMDSSLAPVIAWMNEHLTEQLTLEAIARRAHTSVRTLSRRFRQQTGQTPMEALSRMRLRQARSLLETTDETIERIAVATGLGSAANLRRHFVRAIGTGPTAYRRAFRREQSGNHREIPTSAKSKRLISHKQTH